MDVCSVIGTEKGAQVLSLASALLATDRLRTYFADPARVISLLNGEAKDPNAFAQQRFPGTDLMRLVRGPIFRLIPGDECFEAVFLSSLMALAGNKEIFSSYSSEQSCCLMVYKNAEAYTNAIKDHAVNAFPSPKLGKEKDKWVVYFTPVQMFTFLVLLITSSATRETFKTEAWRALYDGDGSWMAQHAILTSTRVSLLPFTQWLQVRSDPRLFKVLPVHPRPSEINYLPTFDDNCVLVKTERLPDIGQIFGSLIPLELVNWIVHQKDGGQFAGHKSFYKCHAPRKIAAKPVDLMMVVFYYFYQLSLRDMSTSNAVETVRMCSFPQFINLAVSVLSRDDWVGAVKYPSVIKAQLEAMRGSLARGVMGTDDRLLLAMLQIAVVFREREPVVPPRIRYDRWEYVQVQTFTHDHFALLRPHCSPSAPIGEFGAILFRNTRVDVLRRMLSRFIDGVSTNRDYGLELRFVSFVHAEYTNSEVATLVLVPVHNMSAALQALQIYLHASAVLANPKSKLDTRQMQIGFLGSLLSGGPSLFHWLNLFPRCLVPPKEKPKRQLDMDLDSSSSDDDDEQDDESKAAEAFLFNTLHVSVPAWEGINILCKPGFVAKLLKEAIKEDEQQTERQRASTQEKLDKICQQRKEAPKKVISKNEHRVFRHTLLRIVMMCSSRVCLSFQGIKSLHLLNSKFYDDFLFTSSTFKTWGLLRRNAVWESLSVPRLKETWFEEPELQHDEEGLFDDPNKDALPSLSKVDDELALKIMRDIESDLLDDATACRALRKFAQFCPISRLRPKKLGVYFPWLKHTGDATVINSRDVSMEHANPSTIGHLQSFEIRAMDAQDDEIIAVFGAVCGLQIKDVPAKYIASGRLFLSGRSSADVLLPVDPQLNVFRVDLARIGSQLVDDLMFNESTRIINGGGVVRPMFLGSERIIKKCEKFIHTQSENKRAKLDHAAPAAPAPAPAAAAAAAAAAPRRAATQAASSIHAEHPYSPMNAGYSSPVHRPSYDPPSDDWRNDSDFTSRLDAEPAKSASQLDPSSFAGGAAASSSGRKKRSGHP